MPTTHHTPANRERTCPLAAWDSVGLRLDSHALQVFRHRMRDGVVHAQAPTSVPYRPRVTAGLRAG